MPLPAQDQPYGGCIERALNERGADETLELLRAEELQHHGRKRDQRRAQQHERGEPPPFVRAVAEPHDGTLLRSPRENARRRLSRILHGTMRLLHLAPASLTKN